MLDSVRFLFAGVFHDWELSLFNLPQRWQGNVDLRTLQVTILCAKVEYLSTIYSSSNIKSPAIEAVRILCDGAS